MVGVGVGGIAYSRSHDFHFGNFNFPKEGGTSDNTLIAQHLAKEVKFKYKFYMVPGGGYGSLKNGRSFIKLSSTSSSLLSPL